MYINQVDFCNSLSCGMTAVKMGPDSQGKWITNGLSMDYITIFWKIILTLQKKIYKLNYKSIEIGLKYLTPGPYIWDKT
ncbi:hypothetical protein DWZ14_09450 [Enterocloster citroniae]|nr:hypothetical protein DWZ14_09450 [Enterocloster citroniae]